MKNPVTPGSGNVFADLERPRPEEELTKAQLASAIHQTARAQRLTQSAAAKAMGVDQPKVSALFNGRLGNFSSERLLKVLTRLGLDVEIRLKPLRRGREGRFASSAWWETPQPQGATMKAYKTIPFEEVLSALPAKRRTAIDAKGRALVKNIDRRGTVAEMRRSRPAQSNADRVARAIRRSADKQ